MLTHLNPLADAAMTEAGDQSLVRLVQSGSKEALEALITQHQRWIYNIALRMVCLPQDAEDATQEILIKVLTKLSTFRGESQFRTWLYRLAVNHLLNMKRGRAEAREWTFEDYGRELDHTPEADPPAPDSERPDAQLLLQEAKIGCTSGMLLCLDREQRVVYVLGEIFGVTDRMGAELLEISRDSFRQKLARARRDLCNFMQGKCGLVKASILAAAQKRPRDSFSWATSIRRIYYSLASASSKCGKWWENGPSSSMHSSTHTLRSTGATHFRSRPTSPARCGL